MHKYSKCVNGYRPIRSRGASFEIAHQIIVSFFQTFGRPELVSYRFLRGYRARGWEQVPLCVVALIGKTTEFYETVIEDRKRF